MDAILLLMTMCLVASAEDVLKDDLSQIPQGNDDKVEFLLDEMLAMQQQLKRVEEEFQQKLDRVEHELRHERSKMAAMEKHLQLAQMTPRHDQEEDQIAFSVVSKENFNRVTVDTNIPFPEVYVNVGSGWNSVINVFSAPKAGVYSFHANVVGTDDGYARISIVQATAAGLYRKAGMQSTGNGVTTAAASVILEMEVGDLVSVQLHADGSGNLESSESDIWSSFCGFLLFP